MSGPSSDATQGPLLTISKGYSPREHIEIEVFR
jgi:hypothetical protein